MIDWTLTIVSILVMMMLAAIALLAVYVVVTALLMWVRREGKFVAFKMNVLNEEKKDD